MTMNTNLKTDLVIKLWMMFWYITYCFKFRVDPWKFFQLNADYFNKKSGIYSKLEINLLIPFQWRLKQWVHDRVTPPQQYPVFLKPEWGQNSYGIYRADSQQEFDVLKKVIADKEITYVLQEAARQNREFEVYYVRRVDKPDMFASFSVTEVENKHENKYPINGKNNIHTAYRDRTQSFRDDEKEVIWNHVKKIGNFRMARVCMKADSKSDLLQGKFHIVEINLFTPMPLNLLDPETPWTEKAQFIKESMFFLAENTRAISAKQERKSIFFKKLAMHYRVKS